MHAVVCAHASDGSVLCVCVCAHIPLLERLAAFAVAHHTIALMTQFHLLHNCQSEYT